MVMGRQGEAAGEPLLRGDRLFVANGRWFFDSREGVQFGPFPSKTDAFCALAVYVAQHVEEAAPMPAAGSEAPGGQDGIAHLVEEVVAVLGRYRDYGPLAAANWSRSRIEALRAEDRTPDSFARIRVLEFTLTHPEQTFDFERFLDNRAVRGHPAGLR